MRIEQLDTKVLIPYARNARLHSERQIQAIAGSVQTFGFNNPVLIDKENGIIAGHGRVLAAQLIGMKKVPCIRLDHLSETDKRAYIIADNRLQEIGGGWDQELLSVEVDALADVGFDGKLLSLDGLIKTDADKYDFSDFEKDIDGLDGCNDKNVVLTVPQKYHEALVEALSDGGSKTAPSLGRGALKKCGLL
jgi:hypothetical protein